MARSRHNITIDDDVWKNAGKILNGIGMARSKFIEITLRGLGRTQDTLYEDVMSGLFDELVGHSRIARKKEKPK